MLPVEFDSTFCMIAPEPHGAIPAMRASRRRRPRRREIFVEPGVDLHVLAEQVTYVGSAEHKDVPGFAGPPRPRTDASICPRAISDRQTVREWLRTAIRNGVTGAPWEGTFPRYVWYRHGNTVFEGRLINRVAGSYKGYPLEEREWPDGVQGCRNKPQVRI